MDLRDDGQPSFLPSKFKNMEALAASYTSLERQQSQRSSQPLMQSSFAANTERGEPLPNPLDEPQAQSSPQVASEADDTIPDLEFGEASSPPLQDLELDRRREVEDATQRALEGRLDEDTLARLEKAGISRSVVTELQSRAAKGQAAVHQLRMAEVLAPIGGKSEWARVENWASSELDPETLKSYNRLLGEGDKGVVTTTIKSLHAEYIRSLGPQLIDGSAPSSDRADVYESRQEMVEDMKTAKYKTDPAFRSRVAAKSIRSTFKI